MTETYDERGAARYLGCSAALLRRMRRERRGPRWTRVGRLVRYPERWLSEYVEAQAVPKSYNSGGADEAFRGKGKSL